MKPCRLSRSVVAALGSFALVGAARAAQTDIMISMSEPAGTPAIHGPAVIGWNPNTPFLHAIAATGAAPLTYAATGLPAGMTVDPGTGIISGMMPAAGSYPVTVTVSNASGMATATITLVSGPTLSLTPSMGWNSYDSYGGSVNEKQVLDNAKALKTTLAPLGWNVVVIDFHWYDPEDLTDANGRWLPSPSLFPSSANGVGFKAIADQVHAMGLLFGIHIMRGIPQSSYKANKPIAGSSYTAQQAGNSSDITSWDMTHNYGVKGNTPAGQAWYDSIFAQYASWGLDFVKVDDCVIAYHLDEVRALRAAMDKSGRSIVFSLSPGPTPTSSLADLNANANQWRIVNDFWDQNPLTPLYNGGNNDVFFFAGQWQAVAGLQPGHWPDPDMLPLGQLGSRKTAFSHNQQITILTLWSLLPAPLIFGGETPALANDAWTTALLTNEEVLAIDQDPAGKEAKRIAQQGKTEVWSRELSLGRKAVALFNHDTQDAMVSVTFAQLGIAGSPVAVRDVWQHMDATGVTSGISVNVPHEGALLYVLTPPGAGVVDAGQPPSQDASPGDASVSDASSSDSDNGGTGGAPISASGGSRGSSGGTDGSGGSSAGSGGSSGSSHATGGSSGLPGGTGGTGGNAQDAGSPSGPTTSGGAAGTSHGTGGAAPAPAGAASNGSGCSCDVGDEPGSNGVILLWAVLCGVLLSRSRRSLVLPARVRSTVIMLCVAISLVACSSGGESSNHGSGGGSATGGGPGSGGMQSSGGSPGTDGGRASGGSIGSGGRAATGGTGGVSGTGGAAASGGTPGSGGASGTGGGPAGGHPGSGGQGPGGAASGTGGSTGGATGSGGAGGTTGGARPCDIYQAASTPCAAAHSTVRALYGAYSGPLYQVSRASDNTTKDIGVVVPGGFADSQAQDAFCAGTTCTIPIIYDQSPHGNHLRVTWFANWLPKGGKPAPAAAAKIMVGGHAVYGIKVTSGSNVAYRTGAPLSGTASVTSGSSTVTFSTPQTLPMGAPLMFAAQLPSCTTYNCPFYSVAAATTASTTASLTAKYMGPSSTATTTWNEGTEGVAKADQPEAIYAVLDGSNHNTGCCFDYGNSEINGVDDGAATMEALYWGADTQFGQSGGGSGPWVGVDIENGLSFGYANGSAKVATNTSVTFPYVTAMVKGLSAGQCPPSLIASGCFELKAGNAQSGALAVKFDATTGGYGARPPGYTPMKKMGGIILGTGGDGSASGIGTWFEGAVTMGAPPDSADDDVQANVVAAGYGR